MPRNRIHYSFIIALVIALGLLSRAPFMPTANFPNIGDGFYALMMYFGWAFLLKDATPKRIFLISLSLCFAIELSQLYQADWINSIRSYKLGALVLGHGFLWSDLFAYTIGSGFGFLMESRFLKRSQS